MNKISHILIIVLCILLSIESLIDIYYDRFLEFEDFAVWHDVYPDPEQELFAGEDIRVISLISVFKQPLNASYNDIMRCEQGSIKGYMTFYSDQTGKNSAVKPILDKEGNPAPNPFEAPWWYKKTIPTADTCRIVSTITIHPRFGKPKSMTVVGQKFDLLLHPLNAARLEGTQ